MSLPKVVYFFNPISPEPGGGEIITESVGYVPPDRQIAAMIQAGEALNVARSYMYDFPSGTRIDDEFSDPTRVRNFDMADAHGIKEALEIRLKAQRDAREAEQKALKDREFAEAVSQAVKASVAPIVPAPPPTPSV
ncbi:MAG: hypothetical protein LBC53_09210 [Spirochaetaceae bacterium]|jgi:hypothetical protein|nr:hypothetical protein [Spirochaetaceae bacterium]